MKNRNKRKTTFMENMRKSILGKKQKLKTKTILRATTGDPEALMEVVDAYQPYIEKLSMRMVIDKDGQYKEVIDETVKRTLETSLIAAVMKFNPFQK